MADGMPPEDKDFIAWARDKKSWRPGVRVRDSTARDWYAQYVRDEYILPDMRFRLLHDQLSRMWLHQANKGMNDFIGKKVLGRVPEKGEQPNILQDYANTSSAGSIIAFSKYSDDMAKGDIGLICSFGAGYSVGSVIVEKA